MRRTRGLAIFASIITISVLSASTTLTLDTSKIFNGGTAIPSATTIINGNTSLAAFPGITGSGLPDDPYIIEDTVFDAAGTGTALWILSTTLFVTLRNCTFKNSGTGSNAGLRIDQCSNVTVTNCSIYNNRNGIYLSVSKDIVIIGNNISMNTNIGIFLESSNNSMISGNLIHQNGIHGISVTLSSGANEFTANSFVANGAHFFWDTTGPGNAWNVGIIGNFWDDYKTRYPLATNNTFNYNTPYEISSVLNQRDEYPLVSFAGIHDPIEIDGNAELDAFPHKSGAGTKASPYKIEGLKIAAGTSPNCILIKSTDKYLILDNLTLSGASKSPFNAGIKIEGCSNIDITNCQLVLNSIGIYIISSVNASIGFTNCTRNGYTGLLIDSSSNSTIHHSNMMQNIEDGIHVTICQNITILDSNCTNNGKHGAYIYSGEIHVLANNSIIENNCTGVVSEQAQSMTIASNHLDGNEICGIDLYHAFNCTTIGNNISGSEVGIYLRESTLITLGNNKLQHCNIVFRDSLLDYMVNHNINASNTVDGKPIMYVYNQNNMSADVFTAAGSLIIVNCTNATIEDLTFSPATKGLQLYYSTNISVIHCSFSGNQYAGIYAEYSTFCKIRNSFFHSNNKSIEFWFESNDNIFENNTITNDVTGIVLRDAQRNEFKENRLNGCGFWIETGGSDLYLDSHEIDMSNRVNQKPVYYYVNKTNLGLANFTNAGQIILVNCSNSTIGGCDVSNATVGVLALNCNNNTFTQINSSFNSWYGIAFFQRCNDNKIIQSILNNNSWWGLLIAFDSKYNIASDITCSGNERAGVEIGFAGHNTVKSSTMMKNGNGIVVDLASTNATLLSNTVAYNREDGIFLNGMNDHDIIGNNVSFNSGIGIHIGPGSQMCNIYLNLVVDNAISEVYSSSPTNNAWDNGSIGNFWGDYTTRYPGANRTGNIWNIPYEINGTPGVFDHHPFYRNAVPRADFTVDRQIVLVGKPVSFSFTGSIGDAPYSVQWSFGDGMPNSTTFNPVHAFSIQQEFTVTLAIADRDGEISVRRLILHVLSASGDYDGDGLSNNDELEIYGTNPMLKDNDGDGFSDGDEVSWKTDPLNASDNPVTKWFLFPSIIGVLALLIGIGITRARLKKQKPVLTTLKGAHELSDQTTPRTPEGDAQRKLAEKQQMLSRIISPRTQSEIAAETAAQEIVESEGMKVKKMKAEPGVDEHVERKIDEKLEAELDVQFKEEDCIVCGTSLKGTSYVCPFCKTKYCIRCAIMLSERQENCWACKNALKFD